MSHFDELTYLRYIDGQLPAARAVEIRSHLDACTRCRGLVDGLEHETLLLRDALTEADEEIPARMLPASSKDLSWVLLGLTGLAVLGLYTLWNGIVMPWLDRLQTIGVDRETFVTVVLFKGVFWEGWMKMGRNLIQGALILMSIILAISVLRRSWRFWRPSTLILLGLICLLVPPRPTEAAVIETDIDRYILERDETIDNDLIVVADSVRIEGTINGDLIAAGETVTVTGHITGDVLAICERVEIQGQVDGSVRTGSESLDMTGRVGRNVTSGADSVELHAAAVVDGSVTLAANRVTLDGRIGRDIIIAAESTHVNGSIGGGALMAGRSLRIGPAAEIRAEATFYGGEEPEVSPEARLAFPLDIRIKEEAPSYRTVGFYVRGVLKWAAAFTFGLVMYLLMPVPYHKVVRSSSRYGLAILAGVVVLVVVPVIAVIVCLTLVGLPVGLTALLGYAVALYSGQVFVGSWLGREILGSSADRMQELGQLALGLALIHAAGHIPYVGWLVTLIVTLWGLGALTLSVAERASPAAAAV